MWSHALYVLGRDTVGDIALGLGTGTTRDTRDTRGGAVGTATTAVYGTCTRTLGYGYPRGRRGVHTYTCSLRRADALVALSLAHTGCGRIHTGTIPGRHHDVHAGEPKQGFLPAQAIAEGVLGCPRVWAVRGSTRGCSASRAPAPAVGDRGRAWTIGRTAARIGARCGRKVVLSRYSMLLSAPQDPSTQPQPPPEQGAREER